ncbi:unnamed protein product [Spirodela intermedia]|uniref:Uncharacterized protein n=1 Tax=Spirodela intermedia TaxID=51605 RepID=A0A7I8LBW4_SPIIN|nr:unnamed protein product [Spirodela intermedia]
MHFKQWKALLERQIEKKIKRLRTDNDLEFYSTEFNDFYKNEGIVRHKTICYTPQQNELGNPLDYSNLKIFGCLTYVHINDDKLKPRAKKCIFLSYAFRVKGYKLWLLDLKSPKFLIEKNISLQNQNYSLTCDRSRRDTKPALRYEYIDIVTYMDVKTTFLHGNLEEHIYIVDTFMTQHEFSHSKFDNCVYFKKLSNDSFLYLLLYVEDMLIAPKDIFKINKLKAVLNSEFDLKDLRAAKKILRMEIYENFISHVPYFSAIGSMMYAMICTHLDISHAISVVSHYMANPNLDKQMSLTSYIFSVSGCAVSWKASLQSTIALSIIETKFMALTEALKKAIWLRGLLFELCSCQASIIIHYQMYHKKTKHIDIKHYFIRDIIFSSEISVQKIGTEDNLADMLIKPLPISKL